MRLLLDTNAFLWWAEESRKLGRKAAALITSPASEIWVSAATIWEIANKAAIGRLRLRRLPSSLLPRELERNDFRPLAISVEHALAAAGLPRHHEDPFDRMLIAQAQIEDLKVMTADRRFESYDVELVDATE